MNTKDIYLTKEPTESYKEGVYTLDLRNHCYTYYCVCQRGSDVKDEGCHHTAGVDLRLGAPRLKFTQRARALGLLLLLLQSLPSWTSLLSSGNSEPWCWS